MKPLDIVNILVGGFKHGFYFAFHIWDVILPIDELILLVDEPTNRLFFEYYEDIIDDILMKYNYSNSNQLSKTLCFGSQVMVSMVLTLDIAPALETTLMPHHYFASGPLPSFITHCSTDRCQTYHTYHISGSFFLNGNMGYQDFRFLNFHWKS